MYNEEYERKYIESISCSDGDCLIFHVDTDLYDDNDLIDLEKEFKEKMPNLKIIFVPNDLINDITHIKNPCIVPIYKDCINNINHRTPITTSYSDEDMNSGWSKLD